MENKFIKTRQQENISLKASNHRSSRPETSYWLCYCITKECLFAASAELLDVITSQLKDGLLKRQNASKIFLFLWSWLTDQLNSKWTKCILFSKKSKQRMDLDRFWQNNKTNCCLFHRWSISQECKKTSRTDSEGVHTKFGVHKPPKVLWDDLRWLYNPRPVEVWDTFDWVFKFEYPIIYQSNESKNEVLFQVKRNGRSFASDLFSSLEHKTT